MNSNPLRNSCDESWEDMPPTDGGRYCSRCARRILDFTDISDEDLKGLIAQSGGKICGMFDTEQLNRVHFNKDIRPALAAWQKAAAAIAALTALSTALPAQQPARPGEFHVKEQRCETVEQPHRHEAPSNEALEEKESEPEIRSYTFSAEKVLKGPFRKFSSRPIEEIELLVLDGVGGEALLSKQMHAENGEYVLEEPAAGTWPDMIYVQVTWKKKKVKWVAVYADANHKTTARFNQKKMRRRKRDYYLGYF